MEQILLHNANATAEHHPRLAINNPVAQQVFNPRLPDAKACLRRSLINDACPAWDADGVRVV